jgi:hypothetical protein
MGSVIIFPKRRHGRAPAGSRAAILAKASKVISGRPRSSAKRDSFSQYADGIPLAPHPLTVEGESDNAEATALYPPRASMTESGVIMESTLVCDLQTSQVFAHRKTTFHTRCDAMLPMADSREVVFGRLEALRKRLIDREPKARFDVEGRFAEAVGLHKTSWSQIKKYERDFPLTAAFKMKERWQISIDWIYYGQLPGSADLMTEIGRGPVVAIPPARKRKISG